MSSEKVFKIVAPVFVTLESPDGQHSFREDAYVVRRMLQEAEASPDPEIRWNKVLTWLAEKWEVERKELTENMAIHLHNSIMGLVEEKNKEIAAANFTNASSQGSTQESPATTCLGK